VHGAEHARAQRGEQTARGFGVHDADVADMRQTGFGALLGLVCDRCEVLELRAARGDVQRPDHVVSRVRLRVGAQALQELRVVGARVCDESTELRAGDEVVTRRQDAGARRRGLPGVLAVHEQHLCSALRQAISGASSNDPATDNRDTTHERPVLAGANHAATGRVEGAGVSAHAEPVSDLPRGR
jgi:hypothetical protein